jgi:hypothetical protein
VHPIDGRAFRVLAQAGNNSASPFHEIAVRRAPRDRLARAALIDQSFARGDVDAGMEHLDALMRVAPEARAEMLQRVAMLLGYDEMQTALLARLELRPNWRAALAPALAAPETPAGPAAELLERLARKGPLQAGELDARIALLNRLGHNAEARRVWLASLPASQREQSDQWVFDGGFERPDISGGYGWRIAPPPGLLIGYDDIDALEGRSALSLAFDGRAIPTLGMEQALALEPGHYRLEVATENTTRAVRPFVLKIACATDEAAPFVLELPAPVATPQWQRALGEFDIPDSGCTGQVMRLSYLGRSLQERRVSGTLRIDALRLHRSEKDRLQ